MDRAEMVALLRDGVSHTAGVWADLGAGTGNFTYALRELLCADSTIYAIDRDGKAIRRQNELASEAGPGAAIVPIQADFTHSVDLPTLDGVLIANALHFIRDQPATLASIASKIRPGGRLLLVEYDAHSALRWVPFPVPFERFAALAVGAGLINIARVGFRVSPSSGMAMYAAVALRPL
jgi:ubiquinone/menaquinone biosynthesis C-methylase UbiE